MLEAKNHLGHAATTKRRMTFEALNVSSTARGTDYGIRILTPALMLSKQQRRSFMSADVWETCIDCAK